MQEWFSIHRYYQQPPLTDEANRLFITCAWQFDHEDRAKWSSPFFPKSTKWWCSPSSDKCAMVFHETKEASSFRTWTLVVFVNRNTFLCIGTMARITHVSEASIPRAQSTHQRTHAFHPHPFLWCNNASLDPRFLRFHWPTLPRQAIRVVFHEAAGAFVPPHVPGARRPRLGFVRMNLDPFHGGGTSIRC